MGRNIHFGAWVGFDFAHGTPGRLRAEIEGAIEGYDVCMSYRAIAAAIAFACAATAQAPPTPPAEKKPPSEVAGIPVNYDEALVGEYTLPALLVMANGKPVRDAKTWTEKRRPEIAKLFEENEYGRSPGRPTGMSFDVFDKGTPALNGKAIRKQITVYFSADKSGPKMDLLVYLPAETKKPAPLLLNISFSANSSTVDDPGIKPGEVWGRDKKKIPAATGTASQRVKAKSFESVFKRSTATCSVFMART